MPIFWRTYDNKLYTISEVDYLGFADTDASYIPDEYLEAKTFVILRTCFGIGDWGIISAMPRKLKEKYPDCKVYIPSNKLLRSMFGFLEKNWSLWEDPFQVAKIIFEHNPYVDGYIDSFQGDVFNDHYRIYTNNDEPLLGQILRFWQFKDLSNLEPELYFSEDERNLGDAIIKEHCDGKFGTLLISNRYEGEGKDKIQDILNQYDLPMFYWINNPNTEFNFKRALDLRHVNIRIQLYIKTKAQFNVGNQCGVNDTVANYTKTYSVPRGKLGSNFIRSEIYL